MHRALAVLLATCAVAGAALAGCSTDAPAARVPEELVKVIRDYEEGSSRNRFVITTTTTAEGAPTPSVTRGEIVAERTGRRRISYTTGDDPRITVLEHDGQLYLLAPTEGRPARLTGEALAQMRLRLPVYEESTLDLLGDARAAAAVLRGGRALRRYVGTFDPDALRASYGRAIAEAYGHDDGERYAEALTPEVSQTWLVDPEGRVVEIRSVWTLTYDPVHFGTGGSAPITERTVIVGRISGSGEPVSLAPPSDVVTIDEWEDLDDLVP